MPVRELPPPPTAQQMADRWKQLLEGDPPQQRAAVLAYARDWEAEIQRIDDHVLYVGVPFLELRSVIHRRNRAVNLLERLHNEFPQWYQNHDHVPVATEWELVREVLRVAALGPKWGSSR
jgi:hypothetical protein